MAHASVTRVIEMTEKYFSANAKLLPLVREPHAPTSACC